MNLGLATLNNLRGTDISNKIVKLTGDNQKEGVCKVEQRCKGSLTNAGLKDLVKGLGGGCLGNRYQEPFAKKG